MALLFLPVAGLGLPAAEVAVPLPHALPAELSRAPVGPALDRAQSNRLDTHAAVAGAPSRLVREPPGPRAGPGAPSVLATTVLFNDSVISGNFAAGYGTQPAAVAYDPTLHELYVADYATNSVSVVADGSHPGTANKVIASIAVGNSPDGITYDSGLGEMFVSNYGSASVSVIDDATNTVVATVSAGIEPYGIAYDSHNSEVYVVSWNSNSVSRISDATNAVVGTPISVGTDPAGAVFDAGNDQILVANYYAFTTGTIQQVSVISDATNTVVASVSVGNAPVALAYDSGTSQVFVANSGSNNVSVLSSSDKVVATVGLAVGTEPWGLAYDPTQHTILVTNSQTANVSVISDSTDKVVANEGVGNFPGAVTFDSGTSDYYVANYDTANLSVLGGANDTTFAAVPLTSVPLGVAYDSTNGDLYVAEYAADGFVQVINDTTYRVVANITVGSFPVGVAYDPAKQDIYVANSRSNSVSVISGVTNTVTTTIALGTGKLPWGVVYVPTYGQVWVADSGTNALAVLNDTTMSLYGFDTVQGTAPTNLAYDNYTKMVWVTMQGSGNVEVVSARFGSLFWSFGTGASSGPIAVAYDSYNNEIFVTNAFVNNVTVFFEGAYPTTPTIVANPSVGTYPVGALYDPATNEVLVDNSDSDTLSILNTTSNAATGSLSVGTDPQFSALDSAHNTVFTSNLKGGTETVALFPPAAPPGSATVTFTESGLPNGATWYANVSGQSGLSATVMGISGTTVSLVLPNGGYTYVVSTNEKNWTTSATGGFTVAGIAVGIPVPFSFVTYLVTITESGLPDGGTWYANVTGQTGLVATVSGVVGTSVTLELPNGSYAFTAATGWTNWTESSEVGFNVVGAVLNVPVTFSPVSGSTYEVTFSEGGLPSGATWYVNATTQSWVVETVSGTLGTQEQVVLPDGSYTYSAQTNWKNYSAASGGGSFTIAGAAKSVEIAYAGVDFPVIISETGLPAGTSWSVTIGSRTNSTAAPGDNVFLEMNGSLSYTVTAVTGYTLSSGAGTVTVHGQAATAAVVFTPESVSPSKSSGSSSSNLIIGLSLALLAVVVIFLLILFGRRRRKSTPVEEQVVPAKTAPTPSADEEGEEDEEEAAGAGPGDGGTEVPPEGGAAGPAPAPAPPSTEGPPSSS